MLIKNNVSSISNFVEFKFRAIVMPSGGGVTKP